jgi:hypothetical protein
MPDTSLRQTGEACPKAAGAATKAARRLDEVINILMRDSLVVAPATHNKWLAATVPTNKG